METETIVLDAEYDRIVDNLETATDRLAEKVDLFERKAHADFALFGAITDENVGTGDIARLADAGVSVAPFKAQNMSNNARVALAPDGEWGEIGVSQHVQARAAEVPATTDMNPVLLKPRGDGESQLVIDGAADDHVAAGEYYESHWDRARDAAVAAHRRLAGDYDVVVAEGAGSIAEINLHDRDLANVECARFADAAILIAVDIERGGAFASLYGTLELLPDDVRDRVAGAVATLGSHPGLWLLGAFPALVGALFAIGDVAETPDTPHRFTIHEQRTGISFDD